jgi:hypothetical protein
MANKSDRMNLTFKAEDRSSASERRDQLVHQGVAKERAESDAKTVRLKALRLERETAEREAALLAPPKKKRGTR